MELFFADDPLSNRRPFILDNKMGWVPEVNHFLYSVSEENGKTASHHTGRAYGYHLVDWLSYAEKIGLDWKRVSHRHLAVYRNALARDSSVLIGRPIKRETINLRLGMICMFYRFLVRHRYIPKLPFDTEDLKVRQPRDHDAMAHLRRFAGNRSVNPLMYRTHERSLEIPSNENIRRFIHGFKNWRNRLIAEMMWVSGIRRSEACELSVHVIPEDLESKKNDFTVLTIRGKGAKYRKVKFPLRLLRSVQRYVETERARLLQKSRARALDAIWISIRGRPINPAAINKLFKANEKITGVKLTPHLLRHSYAVNRLSYLQDRNVKSALKILQGELGHAHLHTTQIYLHETDVMRAEIATEHADFIARLITREGE